MMEYLGTRYPPPSRPFRATGPIAARPLFEPDLVTGALERTVFEATVERVLDGDMFIVRQGGRRLQVWLLGCDAPELDYQGRGQHPWAELAWRRLTSFVPPGARVRLVTDRQVFEKYGRLLAYVYRGRRCINLEMLRSGWAAPYLIYPNVALLGPVAQAAEEALRARRGIFDPRRPLTRMPYEFRQQADGRPPTKFCGDVGTLRYVLPNEYARVPVARRIFFFTEADARAFGYTPVAGGYFAPVDGLTQPQLQTLTPAATARQRLRGWREPASPLLS